MADNSKKVSELPTASNAALTDRILILRSPAANASVRTITANDFSNSLKTSFANVIPNTTVVGNSVTIASNGTNDVAFFTYTIGAGKTGCCDIQLHAKDANGHNITAGHLIVVANNTAASKTDTTVQIGSNIILFDSNATFASNTVTLYFRRNSAATDNVNIRYSATIY